jgi:hypothetical protein
VALLSSLLVALTLNVPFLPQTPALCGGASVAMVFRYWGDRHADVQQFAPLVDRRAGGIADHVLVDAVRARNWRAVPLVGTVALVRDRIAAGEPLILLLEDRPGRYHYVVAVGADDRSVLVHDPTWGPARRYSIDELTRRWQPANFWALLVTPLPAADAPSERSLANLPGEPRREALAAPPSKNYCDRLLDAALDDIASRGLASADEILAGVIRECPRAAAPLAELAGVRFAQKQWRNAAALAEQAAALDPSLAYAWDLLGASKFIQNDAYGALRAWNRIDKPQLDSVVIDGLSRTRYALVADATGLTPNTTLTEASFRLAERRLRALPNQLAVRIGFRPEDDGFAKVDVAVAERPARPRGPAEWIGAGAHAMVTREVRAAIPGWIGQGELWTASWRWWTGRPRVAASFAAPRAGRLRGVSRVDISWDRQTYSHGADNPSLIETRQHGSFTTTDWLTADVRYELTAGIDSWGVPSRDTAVAPTERRTVSFGGAIERRLFGDRLALAGRAQAFAALSSEPGFRAGSFTAAFRSSPDVRGFVQLVHGGIDVASEHAPLALWSGAGDGHARPPLLRAHRLLRDDRIAGPVFGRDVRYLSVESQRWLERPALVRLGLAAFVDVAAAARGFDGGRSTTHADVGGGIRVRVPGSDATIRADYAHGLRDGRDAFTVGLSASPF